MRRHDRASPMTGTARHPWWHGLRGEWYVVAQLVLMALVVFGPRHLPGVEFLSVFAVRLIGTVLVVVGFGFSMIASLNLGKSLTPLPHPRDEATLRVSGAYRVVRHPIYSGIIIAALGWALWVSGALTLGYALLLFLFFDIKSRREERWLMAKYPDYADYRRRVRKLIPLLY